MQTARLLVEIMQWKLAIKVLEAIVQEDDELIEGWYLLAFSLTKLKKYLNAEECCKNIKTLIEKFKVIDPEMEAATIEIYEQIKPHLKDRAKEKVEDDGFETVSEDENSDEEMT